jgi:hypothetical protein
MIDESTKPVPPRPWLIGELLRPGEIYEIGSDDRDALERLAARLVERHLN